MPLLRSSQNRSKKSVTDTTSTQLSDGHTVTVEAIAPDDTSIIAVPPKALASTQQPIRRASPPRTLLEKCTRRRSSSSRSSFESENISPTAGPVAAQRLPASLPSNFDDVPRSMSKDYVTQLEMAAHLSDNASAGGVSPSRGDVRHPPVARKTRSQSRKQSRADSHDLSAMTYESSNNDPKDNKSGHHDNKFTAKADVPRSLTIRKKEASSTPSPRSPVDGEIIQPPPRSPARKLPSFFRSPSPEDLSPVQAPRPLRLLIPSTPKDISGKEDNPRKGASMKERLAFARARSQSRSPPASPELDAEALKVAVRPPMFDESKGVCQWTSDLPSTSRPDRVWEWPKRWTCCRCDATTIVEQKVCANLECGHYRCPHDCRMIRIARPLGQFVGFGGS